MMISLASPLFDVSASMFVDVDDFKVGKERIHKTSAALAGSIELQDTGMRMQSSLSIVVRDGNPALYNALQYMVANHPTLNMQHPDGAFIIAPSSAKVSGNRITLAALVVGVV